MEDKRVIKTKSNLRNAITELLGEIPFEKITVSEICKRGLTSRITFYSHYADKYDLISEMFDDYVKESKDIYHELQDINNPEGDSLKGYENMIDCMIVLLYRHTDFFSRIFAGENPYLYTVFFDEVRESVKDYIERHPGVASKYGTELGAAILCSALAAVIDVCNKEKMPERKVRKTVNSVFLDILSSDLFERESAAGKAAESE